MFGLYILQNWVLILILVALAIMLATNVFLEQRVIRRMYILIVSVFLLSIVVFLEFNSDKINDNRIARLILMTIRYSATPFILAHIIFTLVKKLRWFIYIPAMVLTVINIISIFTGIVFSVSESNEFSRGFLGYLPFIGAGVYCVILVALLFKRCNKQTTEIIPIVFLIVAFLSGLIFPFVFGKNFSQIFCPTISIALFVYFVFSILQLTKKDALTGLLNRQAYYSDVSTDKEDISALVSLDMNGLKTVNDTYGHAAGDEALITLGLCFKKALGRRQTAYRVGGDEFVIVCRKCTVEEVEALIKRIETNVGETKYTCSIGYSYCDHLTKSIDDVLKESDEIMYTNKAHYYEETRLEHR